MAECAADGRLVLAGFVERVDRGYATAEKWFTAGTRILGHVFFLGGGRYGLESGKMWP